MTGMSVPGGVFGMSEASVPGVLFGVDKTIGASGASVMDALLGMLMILGCDKPNNKNNEK